MTDLGQRIASVGAALTPTERRLAELVLSDPTVVAFGTVADLAREAETSGPTVVRFAAKLEFDGFGGLQEYVREGLTEQLRRPTDRIRRHQSGDAENSSKPPKSAMMANLQLALDGVDDATIRTMAATIAATPGTVLVLGNNISAAPGRLLTDNLRLLRPGIREVSKVAASVAAELADIGPDDVFISIDFPRYEAATITATQVAARSGATVLAVTDGPLSPLSALADNWVGLPINAVGPFDSVLSAVALIELLVAEVAVILRTQATARLDHIEALWTASHVFEDEPRPDRHQEMP